jgi:hypothetical protein
MERLDPDFTILEPNVLAGVSEGRFELEGEETFEEELLILPSMVL